MSCAVLKRALDSLADLVPAPGALLWATAISVAALAVAFLPAWCPRLLRPLAVTVAGWDASRG